MSNSEKINAYFENALSAEEKISLEKEINQNAELKQEFEFQQAVIEGIKTARVQELKTMLNNVPVGGSSISTSLSAGKVAITIGALAIIAFGIIEFTSNEEEFIPTKNYTEQVLDNSDEQNNDTNTDDSNSSSPVAEVASPTESKENISQPSKQSVEADNIDKEVEINKPNEAPMFETGDSDSLEAPTDNILNNYTESTSAIEVEIDGSKKKYDFHYNFQEGKLHLYGTFDKDLYEIIEFNSQDDKSIFLYYKDEFYALDKQQEKIKKLEPVNDNNLKAKLNQLRD